MGRRGVLARRVAEVEGDIDEVQGVLRITEVRLRFRFRAPEAARGEIDRLLTVFAEKCPAYQSVKGCIAVSWVAEVDYAA